MIQVPQLPGFKDSVHDAQTTFRSLLAALANPGRQCQIGSLLKTPVGLSSACAAACLTLLDLETQVWLQPTLKEDVKNWLLFHTSCRFTDQPEIADFAIIHNCQSMPLLSTFKRGTEEEPEASTTLFVQVENFESGHAVTLTGPGIKSEQVLTVTGLSSIFWEDLTKNVLNYPLGIDIFLFTTDKVIGLPRTTKLLN